MVPNLDVPLWVCGESEDYNIDPNTYVGEFFQEDGLQGSFQIDLTEAIEMEVDNESFVHEVAGMRFIMRRTWNYLSDYV